MPVLSITISIEPSGSVTAKGASDDLSAALLKHAGFQQIQDWYGRRHRLPITTPPADRAVIATHAAEMLRAARFDVELDPALDTARLATTSNPLRVYHAGAEVLRLTDQIKAAETGPELARALDHLLDPEDGALERVREALEAASEQITDVDDEAYSLADRFGFAADFVTSAQSELIGYGEELQQLNGEWSVLDARSVARATSPAVARAKAADAIGTGAPEDGAPVPAHPYRGTATRSR